MEQRQAADRRREVVLRVLRVDTRLDRMAVHADGLLAERQRFAGGDAQLPFDEVEAGDHLGHRMLDLKPRVHLEEIEAVGIGDELHRAGAFVADRPRRRDRRAAHRGAAFVVETWGRGFFDHLLMPSLHRAVALEQVHGVAVPVGEHLHLDMARVGQVALEQHAVVAERRCSLLPRGIQRGGEFVDAGDDAHAATAAAGDRLDHQRESRAVGLVGEERSVLPLAMVAGEQRYA